MTDFLQMILQNIYDLLKDGKSWDEGKTALFLLNYRKALEEIDEFIEKDKYKISRFYCDWAFHTKKNRITDIMRGVLEKVDAAIPKDIHTGRGWPELRIRKENMEFIYFTHLREELRRFFEDYKLPADVVTSNEDWLAFLKPLRRLFIEQPIINPTPTMLSFRLLPASSDAVIWIIDFSDERKSVKFGNAD